MNCHNCSAPIPSDSAFCPKCGRKVASDTIADVSERLAKVEGHMAAHATAKGRQQNYLEVDTAEKVMTRVKTWTTLILYFAGIPAAVALLALAVMFGKGALDLHGIAANAQGSVDAVLAKARSEASEAERTASGALVKSKQADSDIRGTQVLVSKLKEDVAKGAAEVQQLSDQTRNAQGQVETLKHTVESQSKQVQHLTEQVNTVQTTKNIANVQTIYPVFGEHRARTLTEWIDPNQKKSGEIYVGLNLSLSTTPNLTDAKVAEAMTRLGEHRYSVFLGGVSTYARTPTSIQQIGMGLDTSSCYHWTTPPLQPPCILYFREDLKSSATEIREIVRSLQGVPDNQVLYVDPKHLDPQKRELLDLSHMDIVVVLAPE